MQTAYTREMAVARAGMRADDGPRDIISRLSEDAAGAAAGTYMATGTLPEEQALAPVAAADVTAGDGHGVVLYNLSKEPALTAAAIAAGNEYDDEQALPILRSGRVWVLCDAGATIVAGAAAYVRYGAGGGGTKLGAFREDADTATAALLPRAQFVGAHTDVVIQGSTVRIAKLELSGV